LFIIGLSKKVLIANVLGGYADTSFANIDSSMAWIGILCYSFQIYFDFAGYSDMAIGIGRMIGFTFPENFNCPYISQSITEFWRRWHISHGAWMRDYLYIPQGGNRVKSKFRLYFNLSIVFVVSGIWHGAAWTFVAWGVIHGLFLIFDRLFLEKLTQRLGIFLRILLTFFIVLNSWVVFRAESFADALLYYQKMYLGGFDLHKNFFNKEIWFILSVAIFFSILPIFKFGDKLKIRIFYKQYSNKGFVLYSVVALLLLMLCVGSITSSGFNPFIYFRF
jgi:alginate O-acetyltransferase complex protein AlgI